MKITCSIENGGCGQRFELTDEVYANFKRCVEEGRASGCLNDDCARLLTPFDLKKLIRLVDARRDPGNAFPLTMPVVPPGRRKNGAIPGINFKQIASKPLDRPPTDEEIERVQRYFAAGLEVGTDCPCCTRHAKRQYRSLGCGPARWLIELIYLSEDGKAIHTGEIIKSLKGNSVSGSDATSVLPLYGMIEAAPDPAGGINAPPPSKTRSKRTSGFWKPSKIGRAFALDKIRVPEKVVTCLGVPEGFEGEVISIRDALGKKFDYDEIMGR